MKEIIERLKDKNYVRAFGLMKPEEQTIYVQLGTQNCIVYHYSAWNIPRNPSSFDNHLTYAIKSNYRPEPEYVDLEIKESNYRLGVFQDVRIKELISEFTCISLLPSLPNFEGFYSCNEGYHISITRIARNINQGHKIYAKFRKQFGVYS